jgi:hypothetical protein
VTNGLAEGKTFDSVLAAKNVSATVLPPFSRKDSTVNGIPNPSDASQLISKTFSLAPGKVSDFAPTRTGGFLVYLKSIEPVSEATMQSDLPDFTRKLRQSRQYEAFMEWFRKQMEVARISLPGEKQRGSPN